MKDFFRKDLKFAYHPWWFFFLFLFCNSLLTFGRFSPALKISIFLFGLGLPWLGAVLLAAPAPIRQKPSFRREAFKKFLIPAWAWILLVLAAFISRFGPLTNSGRWPVPDESLVGRDLLALDQHWHWRLFETMSQVSSLPTYLGWLVFKITGSAWLALQFSPALFSFMALGAGILAARLFFPKPVVFILGIFLAFSYGPIFMWITNAVVLWECLVFYCLGRLEKNSGTHQNGLWFFVLGALAGLGPSVAFSWPAMWIWFAALAAFHWVRGPHPSARDGWAFSGAFAAALVPFALTAWRTGYGGHIWATGAWSDFSSGAAQAKIIVDYVRVLFWGGPSGLWTPAGGGFLNVFLGTWAGLGAIEVFQARRTPFYFYLTSAFLAFLLPGFFSHDIETFRIILVLIPALTLAAIGLNSLLLALPAPRRAPVLSLALVLGCGLDLPRALPLLNSVPLSSGAPAFNDRRFSYETLRPIANQLGPGLVFSEMVPFTTDNSLLICSYPFNAALNPGLAKDQKVSWAAVFTDWHYVPFLQKRFPRSSWTNLNQAPGIPGRHWLGIILVDSKTRPLLNSWAGYYRSIESIDFQFIETPTGRFQTPGLQNLLDFYPSVPDDPFLQSCFFEKLLFNYSAEKAFNPDNTWACWANFQDIFQKSFQKSYRDNVLCLKFSRLLESEGAPGQVLPRKLGSNIKK